MSTSKDKKIPAAKPKMASLEAIRAYKPVPKVLHVDHPELGRFTFRQIIEGLEYAEIVKHAHMRQMSGLPITVKDGDKKVEIKLDPGIIMLAVWAVKTAVEPELGLQEIGLLYQHDAPFCMDMLGRVGVFQKAIADPTEKSNESIETPEDEAAKKP